MRVLLDALDEDTMIKIVTEPKDAVFRQYKKLFELSAAVLQADENALRLIAREALASNVGALRLRSIFEDLLLDPMFEIESFCTYTITVVDGVLAVAETSPLTPK